MGGSEMGQGSYTVACQIVAEELGLPIGKVMVADAIDSYYTPYDKTTTSSRFTFMMGNTLILACNDIKDQLIERASISWKIPGEAITVEQGVIKEIGGEGRTALIAELGKSGFKKELPPLVGRGLFSTACNIVPADPETAQSPRPTTFWIYGTQAAEVEVDPKTGDVDVVRFVAAHDCGKALNPHTCKQQVEGAIVMGLGHALREELIYENGIPRNPNMVDFKVPTVRDFPVEADIVFVDAPHPEGPYGAKGVGETALTATCAAIGTAVSNAVGHGFRQVPIKAEQILEAIKMQMTQ
jgi:carbon-monoxide dehydrogenase large subunit